MYWTGDVPKDCQLCGVSLKKTFVDGWTRRGWAYMCTECHKDYGCGLGTGEGQKYEVQPDQRWKKVA
jgi:hypothetical protein